MYAQTLPFHLVLALSFYFFTFNLLIRKGGNHHADIK